MRRKFLGLMAGVLFGLGLGPAEPADSATAPDLSVPFWQFWSDGKAEMDGYDLIQPRYGEPRHGRAALIFVTEPFSRSKNVKVDEYDPKNPDHFIAMKLNLVRKFQTGIYDYSLMTSLFVDPAAGFAPVKLSFSSQEWCGHVYQELLFEPGKALNRVFSYFEGETREESVELPAGAISEDNLFFSLRGLGRQELAAEGGAVKMLGSVTQRRLQHRPLAVFDTEVVWSAQPFKVQVPAGEFEVREAKDRREDGKSCTFQLEVAYPHRIVAWSCEDGEQAKLTGSTRLDYWRTHAEGDEKLLQQMGLSPMHVAP